MNTQTRRRQVPITPAVYQLSVEGSSLRDVADATGVTRSCISAFLTGIRPVPNYVEETLVDLLGQGAANRVLAHVPPRRPRKAAAKATA